MEKHRYKCNYCYQKFIPNRRRIQKYCSATCRSKAYHYRKSQLKIVEKEKGLSGEVPITESKDPGMTLSGVGNAAAGTLAVNLLTKAFTPEHKKPATKEDIQRIENRIGKFHLVANMPPNPNGLRAYFDTELKSIVYKNPLLIKNFNDEKI